MDDLMDGWTLQMSEACVLQMAYRESREEKWNQHYCCRAKPPEVGYKSSVMKSSLFTNSDVRRGFPGEWVDGGLDRQQRQQSSEQVAFSDEDLEVEFYLVRKERRGQVSWLWSRKGKMNTRVRCVLCLATQFHQSKSIKGAYALH